MQTLRMGLAILGTLAIAGVSQAAVGTVSISWDGCTGPVDKTTTVAGPHSFFITVLGHDGMQLGYDVRFLYGNASQQVPDAWRFDEAGCKGNGLIFQDIASKLCPSFSQNGTLGPGPIKKIRFSPDFDPYPQTLMQVILAQVYSVAGPANPATRYLLERVTFDLSYAVPGPGEPGISCGGFEEPMCFKLSYASYLDTSQHEQLFNLSGTAGAVSFNGPSACSGAVPVKPKTWGSIKSQYRN